MHSSVRSRNSVLIVCWILLSVSKSTDALGTRKTLPNPAATDLRCLVQNDHLAVLDQRTRKAQQRPLADAQVCSFALDHALQRILLRLFFYLTLCRFHQTGPSQGVP